VLVSTRSAQKASIPKVQMGGSFGPFVETTELQPLAKEVFESYDAVLFREPATAKFLISLGFSMS
jgi:polysaccharide pyruvyl transferase WcaK-like protein